VESQHVMSQRPVSDPRVVTGAKRVVSAV